MATGLVLRILEIVSESLLHHFIDQLFHRSEALYLFQSRFVQDDRVSGRKFNGKIPEILITHEKVSQRLHRDIAPIDKILGQETRPRIKLIVAQLWVDAI